MKLVLKTRDVSSNKGEWGYQLFSIILYIITKYLDFVWSGWVDTDAVRTAMPDFYQKMKDKLKSPS